MRIFQIITASEYGGAQTIVSNLVKTLSPNHELFILYGGNGEAWSALGDGFTRIKLNGHRKEVSWKDIFLVTKLLYYRIKYKPDIVHLHTSKMGVLGRIAFNPKKIVYTVHGFDSIRKIHRQFLSIEKALKNRAARIIGVSQYDVDAMKEDGITHNTQLIYNGVTDHSLEYYDMQDSISKALDILKVTHPKIVMCIARVSKQKKFDLFVDIARAIPQYAFVWIGNKEEMKGMPRNVFCLGEASSAYKYLKYANLFVLPSNYEGLPMSILEALAFGVPIVASAVGGVPELLDGKTGFAVENDVKSFEEKINYILSDESREQEMSRHARDLYVSKFTINEMVDEYKSVFNEIASTKG